jgi:SanA protein
MKIKKIIILFILTSFFAVIFYLFCNLLVINSSKQQIYFNDADIPKKQIALVLGARVYQNGSLSDIMSDRAITAINIYKEGKVDRILISGDHGKTTYDEVNAIKKYMLNNGVAEEDLFLDHAGFDTYDSVYRAKEIFQVESMTIITQEFHLYRAIYIANELQIDAIGLAADLRTYRSNVFNQVRESAARVKAVFDVVLKAKPKYLGQKIPITSDSKLSWD